MVFIWMWSVMMVPEFLDAIDPATYSFNKLSQEAFYPFLSRHTHPEGSGYPGNESAKETKAVCTVPRIEKKRRQSLG